MKGQEEEFPALQPWGRVSLEHRHEFAKESEMGKLRLGWAKSETWDWMGRF
jgi:hypothetical protein